MDESSAPSLSLIIVYWNSGKYLARCLDCLSAQTYQDFEIMLVDNGSTDGGLADVVDQYPRLLLRIERLSSNLGFAAANNLGATLARGQWLVLLNTDAFPEPDWLANLVRAAANHPEIASFSSRQLQANEPSLLDTTGDAYHVSGLAWHLNAGYPADSYGQIPQEVFSPCAAAAMYARNAFQDVGGFDEQFFSYFEDVDLGFRLQLRGYRCLYVADAVVQHVGSGALGVRSDFAFYHVHRNMVWTFVKNMPTGMFWRYLPAHLFANMSYLLSYAMRGRGRVLWQAKWDALRGLPRILAQRRSIQAHKRTTSQRLRQLMERGWVQPYTLEYKRRKAVRNRT